MGADIITTAGDKRISLTGSQPMVRVMNIGSDWTKLRIGMRLAVNSSGLNLDGATQLALGVCAGTASPYGDPVSTTHFIGWRRAVSTWTYNAGPPAYFSSSGGFNLIKKVGITVTSNPGTEYAQAIISADPTVMQGVVIQLMKFGGTMRFWATHQAGLSFSNLTDDLLYNYVNEESRFSDMIPSGWSWGAASGFLSVAFDEGVDGALNCLNLYWNGADPLEVSGLVYKRWATGAYSF